MLRHRLLGTFQDAYDLLHRETVEELTHPDGVQSTLAFREECLGIEQVNAITADALRARFVLYVLFHHTDLLGQVEDGNLHLVVITHTLQSPFARITTHIVQRLDVVLVEDDLQGLREG